MINAFTVLFIQHLWRKANLLEKFFFQTNDLTRKQIRVKRKNVSRKISLNFIANVLLQLLKHLRLR